MHLGPRLFVMLLLIVSPSLAQMGSLQTVTIPLDADSGELSNISDSPGIAWTETIQLPGVASFRLRLEDVELTSQTDVIVITSLLDGETQRLDATSLRRWYNQSAWFNGSAVTISLQLGGGSHGRVRVGEAIAILGTLTTDDICGSDNRVLSNDNRVFRLLLTGSTGGGGTCTGWLISDRATFLTAGHCFGGLTNPSMVAEFNVPLSTSSGIIVHPSIANQYPGDETNILFEDNGVGEDWAVSRLHPNNLSTNAALFFGFFGLATSVPQFMTARLTGYGLDSTPDPSRNKVQQTSTDALTTFPVAGNPTPPNAFSHDVDSQPGNSGGPLINEATGQAVAIHTHGGCGNFLGSNKGTSIFYGPLLNAISTINGCGGTYLLSGASQNVTCTPLVFSAQIMANTWNLVAITSTSDWNVDHENVTSAFGGTTCDFLIANGNFGEIPSISGEFRRASGTASARAEAVSSIAMAVGAPQTLSWTSTRVVRALDFLATTSMGSLSISVSGDPSLKWHLYRPDSSSGAQWLQRTAGLHSAGIVGGQAITNINIPTTGRYCLVIYRDAGVAAPTPSTVVVNVCAANSPVVALGTNQTAILNQSCTAVDTTPVAGAWNAVGVASSNDTTLSLGTGVSATSGAATEFVVANGHLGSISPTRAYVTHAAGTTSTVVEHVTVAPLGANALLNANLLAGKALRLVPISVTSVATYEFLATGDPSLRWFLFDIGTSSAWRGRSQALASGFVGSTGTTVSLGTGFYAVVIVGDGAVATTNRICSVRLGGTGLHINLSGPGASVPNLVDASYQFTCAPAAGRWNGLGAFGTLTTAWTIAIGHTQQGGSTNSTDYVLANGRLGPISPVVGILGRFGVLSGTFFQSPVTAISVGSPSTIAWSTTNIMHIVEFFVPTSATYDLNVTGVGAVGYGLFRPGTGSGWIRKGDASFFAGMNVPQNGIALQSGWNAIVLSKVLGTVTNGTPITISVVPSTNPVPVLTSANPAFLFAGSITTNVNLTGSGFTPFSTVTLNGTTPLTVLAQTATELQVEFPSGLLQSPAMHAIRVSTPTPGGGTTAPLLFEVRKPKILALNPPVLATTIPLGSSVSVTVQGTSFLPWSIVHAGTSFLATTYVSSTQLLCDVTGLVPEATRPGALALTVDNGHFAQSNTVALPIAPLASNQGTVTRAPLQPNPNEVYTALMEGCAPGGLFSLLADFSTPLPVTQWPNPAGNMVLGIINPAAIYPLVDGIGLFSPPNPGATLGLDPNGTPPGGVFAVPGFIYPAQVLNVTMTLQGIFLDPAAPLGFRLTWPRFEFL